MATISVSNIYTPRPRITALTAISVSSQQVDCSRILRTRATAYCSNLRVPFFAMKWTNPHKQQPKSPNKVTLYQTARFRKAKICIPPCIAQFHFSFRPPLTDFDAKTETSYRARIYCLLLRLRFSNASYLRSSVSKNHIFFMEMRWV